MGRKKRASPRGQLEISVEEAAHRLGVSSRIINNYINDKKLRAVKVAGQWFIDSLSVDALAQSYGLKPNVVAGPEQVPTEGKAALSESNLTLETPQKKSSKPRFKKGSSTRVKNQKGPVRLAVYRLAQEGFSMAGWQSLASFLPASVLNDVDFNQRKIYEYLGAGYYSWGGQKISFYLRARSAVGGIFGILYSRKEYIEKIEPEATFIEKRLLPAFRALLIRLESKRTPDHPRKSG